MQRSKIYTLVSGSLLQPSLSVTLARLYNSPRSLYKCRSSKARCSRLPTPSTATPNPKKFEKCRRTSHLQALAMARRSAPRFALHKKFIFALFFIFSVSTVVFLIRRAPSASAGGPYVAGVNRFKRLGRFGASPSPLAFMKSKRVLLVSHELSLSGGPLLLMELAFLLRNVGAEVCWITNQRPSEKDSVIYSLENKMLHRGVQVLSAKGQEAISTALKADLLVLNTVMAGKWLDDVLKENVPHILPKVLWWIHELHDHYFQLDYVKHLPLVAAAMLDSHVTAEYWKTRTRDYLRIKMPDTYVVHLGNSKDLMEIAEDSVAKRVLREHVREALGVQDEDLLFAMINSVSRGKGQDLFLQSFYESLQLILQKKLRLPSMHAIIVGSDMTAQPIFESQLRDFVRVKKIQDRVHFVNKTITVAPYLSAVDIFVQNSQELGECFGRVTIEAMAFQLPVLGTAAGGTTEIVVNRSTGLLHPTGKEGVTPLARNMVTLATNVHRRLTLGKRGYEKVKEKFLERHMEYRIARVLKEVLQKAKSRPKLYS